MGVTKTTERWMGDSQRTGVQAVNECFSLLRSCVLPSLPTSPPSPSIFLPVSLLLFLSLLLLLSLSP